MKVTNKNIAGTPSKLDAGKTGKADGASALRKDMKTGGLTPKEIKDGSKVDVSERAQLMQKAKEIASGPMDVDESKVARLQKMIDEGKYSVDADKLADRLVDEHMLIPD